MQLDLNAVWKVLARFVNNHMPTCYQEQPVPALKEKAAGVRQLPLPFEGGNARRSQQNRL